VLTRDARLVHLAREDFLLLCVVLTCVSFQGCTGCGGGCNGCGGEGAPLAGDVRLIPGQGHRERASAALGVPAGDAGNVSRDEDHPSYRSEPFPRLQGPRRRFHGVVRRGEITRVDAGVLHPLVLAGR
jgi:hypothetical protein